MIRISELRKEKHITQRELAEAIGVKNYTVANWEQGRTEPGIQDLKLLADYFECSIDYLVEREDDCGNILVNSLLTNRQKRIMSLISSLPEHKQDILIELLTDGKN